ncbi:MAG: hypothetical protein Q9161_003326 [Pseudevernia consocians]
MRHCRPTGVPSQNIFEPSNDDLNWTQVISVPEGAPNVVSMCPLQALMDHCNIQASEIIYRFDSGEVFKVTRTHPEPQEVHTEDRLTRHLSRSSIDAVDDFDQKKLASKSGRARGLPSASHHTHGRTSTKKWKGSSSPSLHARLKRQTIKNRRAAIMAGDNSDSDDEIDELEGAETETYQMRIGDVYPFYYEIAFRVINQLACKDIGKAWIKVGHPRKQTTRPYNGGKKGGKYGSDRSKAEYGYIGHFTRPDYWPSDEGWQDPKNNACRHKEPDHVKRPERLILLVHLLRSQFKGFVDGDFSLDKLRKSTDGIHLQYEKNWTTESLERLEEIYRVREKEMEFERGECDADTLVPIQMPKSRCKGRKAFKSGVKAASPRREQVKEEPGETSPTTCNAPVANMGINVHINEGEMDVNEESEPSILADTSSSTEDFTPDASYPDPTSCEARMNQHELSFFDSAQGIWNPQLANLGQEDPTMFTHPTHFGSIATPSEALPLHGQYRFGSSSMQSFPNQEFVRRQYDHESTAPQRLANGMCPDQTLTRAPPARPVAQKVETIRHPMWAASSSGLVGVDYSSWQTDELWRAQMEPSMYTAVADPSVSLLPCTNGSFSSGYSVAGPSSGLQLDNWNDGNQNAMPQYYQGPEEGLQLDNWNDGNQNATPQYYQGPEEELQQRLNLRAANIPPYHPSSVNAPCGGNPDLANRSFNNVVFRTRPQL